MNLNKIMKKEKLDVVVLLNLNSSETNSNVFYFTEYQGVGCLIITKTAKKVLVVPEMEYERAKKTFNGKIINWNKGRFYPFLGRVITRMQIKIKKAGLDMGSLNKRQSSALKRNLKINKTKDISKQLRQIRSIKSEKEIQNIKKACRLCDKIFKKIISNFKFKTEAEIMGFIMSEMYKNGYEHAFKPVVASGNNASQPHHDADNRKLKKGFCIIDFGARYRGYCSDVTRTIYLDKPSKKEIELYNRLLKIQKNTVKHIKLGMKCHQINAFCRKEMGKLSENFIHGLGHGIGLDIHELPNLKKRSKDIIKNNMVFTIEPGIYFENKIGIRIEDTVLFNKKPIILTKSQKSLVIIRRFK